MGFDRETLTGLFLIDNLSRTRVFTVQRVNAWHGQDFLIEQDPEGPRFTYHPPIH